MRHIGTITKKTPALAQYQTNKDLSNLLDTVTSYVQFLVTKVNALVTFATTGLSEGFFETEDPTILGLR